ncbi:MAG: hypothetical protein KDD73_11485 [Anaerolineales bacterium]|nr:hypothetical protein [Anaerolineales bacterium]MCB9127562.1 hypothetical protein [Ardenticatenales bacterium]
MILELLTSLPLILIGVSLAVSAAIVAMTQDWRLTLISLLVQYFFVTALLALQLPPEMTLIKLLVGVVVTLLLFWSGQHVDNALKRVEGGREWFQRNRAIFPLGLPFRLLTLVLIALVIFSLPESLLSSLVVPRVTVIVALWVIIFGIVTIMLTRDPLKTGVGLLVFQNGFELLYTPLEPGLAVAALLGIANIAVALTTSYLAVVKHMPMIEAWLAEQAWQDPSSPEALAEAVATLNDAPADYNATNGEVLA